MTARLLNGRLSLFDVDDVEGLCRKVIDVQLRKTHAHLRPDDLDDAVSFLIGRCYELSLRYDDSRGLAFSTYSYRILRLRVVDWYRARFSDQRFGGEDKRNIDFPVSLDAAADGSADGDPLGHTIAGEPGDSEAGGFAGRLGALEGGRRATLEDTVIVRELASPSARRRDRGGRRKQRGDGGEVEVENVRGGC